jgi:predicted nuclease of predicted toxin-antitoxin system
MKVKVDENLPLQIAVELRARRHDVQAVGEEGLTGRADAEIWQAAQREIRILITQDLDFSDAPSSALVQQLNVAVVTWACSRYGLGQKVAANLPFGADYGQTFPNLLPKVCRPSAHDSTSITQVAGRLDNGCGTWLRIGVNC